MESNLSPGNPEIHWGISLIYLTLIASFPENKLHSIEIFGVIFLSHNNPLRMQDRKLKGADPQWNPWATVTALACLPLDFWLYRMHNSPVIHGSAFLLPAIKCNLSWLRVKRCTWNMSQNLTPTPVLLTTTLYCGLSEARAVQMEKTSDVLTQPELATDIPHLASHSKRHYPQQPCPTLVQLSSC